MPLRKKPGSKEQKLQGNLYIVLAYPVFLGNVEEKNVRFDPINMAQKWSLPAHSGYWRPDIFPIQ